MRTTTQLIAIACVTMLMNLASNAAPLTVSVMQTSESSLYTSITLIAGAKHAILVDAPFSRADAHRVVAWILESGKELDAVYVTHDHPDHYFSMEVIAQAFPNARIVSQQKVVSDIWKSLPYKVKRWSPMLGANGPRFPSAPSPLDSDHLMLEGERIDVLGPMQGDHVDCTALYVPSAKALIGGDLLFNQVHLWLGEQSAAGRKAWAASVERLAALGATTIVGGHQKPGTLNDSSTIEFTRSYLAHMDAAIKSSRNSTELTARINSDFPQTIDVLNNFILGNSAKVVMGETPLWKE
jgi:glyoxylase-like metal-dependent hydrolase (beta-lactamase superfamily II)